MNRHRNVPQTLELLNQFRESASTLAARSQKLANDGAARRELLARHFDELQAREQRREDSTLAEAAAAHQSEKERQEARIRQRRQRLQRAHRSTRKAHLDRIEAEEGLQKFRVQKGTLDTDREEKSALEANEAWFQEFDGRSGEQRVRLELLERRTKTAMRGFPLLRRALKGVAVAAVADAAPNEILEFAEAEMQRAATSLGSYARNPLNALFRFLPPGLILLAAAATWAAGVWILPLLGRPGWNPAQGGAFIAAPVLGLAVLYVLATLLGRSRGAETVMALTQARALHLEAGNRATQQKDSKRQQIQSSARQRRAELASQWDHAVQEGARRRAEVPAHCEERVRRIEERLNLAADARLRHSEDLHSSRLESIRRDATARHEPISRDREQQLSRLDAEIAEQRNTLESEWARDVLPLYRELQSAGDTLSQDFPAWDSGGWEHWTPPSSVAEAIPFGSIEVDLAQLCGGLPNDARLALPGPAQLSVPLFLGFPEAGSLMVETHRAGAEEALGVLNQILLRLLASMPPGRLNITVIDPVRLGQSFAGVMHLADFEENLINHRIWTQTGEIEQRLADLNAHMEKVIQMYLRNEYATIAEFNAQAGNIGEKYHILVLADFPTSCSDLALKRLVNIATSGARCGVFTLIHRDLLQTLPESVLGPLRQNCVVLSHSGTGFTLPEGRLPGTRLLLTPPPGPDLMTAFLRRVGTTGRDSGRVRVPFQTVMPDAGREWTLETTEELRAPIGRTGATKLQYLALGKGTRQHALVAGKTGSGKSTLFHVLINSLAAWCSPDQVEFYLVDFKKGVEFSCYASWRLPHARVVAIESDREFGLSVLQKVDEELRRRGDLFRRLGVQDLAGHHRASGGQPLPRALLLIDEFQEFFVEDDRISQTAAVLLDRIVRQGRAFGIHVVLGSQTLGGAYTLARTTLGQMVVRIALQCNEADALLIMDEAPAGDDGIRVAAMDLSRIALPVLPANEQELAEHEDLLTQIDKSSGGKTIWRTFAGGEKAMP